MYQMFVTRHALHLSAYQHKTTQAVEIMSVCDGVGGWQDIASTYNYEGLGGWQDRSCQYVKESLGGCQDRSCQHKRKGPGGQKR